MSKASVYFSLANLDDRHDVKRLKRELNTISGVLSVSVNSLGDTVAVDFDSTGTKVQKIEEKLNSIGFIVSDRKTEAHVM